MSLIQGKRMPIIRDKNQEGGRKVATDLFEKGLDVRRAVLGKDFVDKSIGDADEFTRPLQELVTEYCWGRIWTRPGLSRKTRSLINLAMLTALNRPHEVKLHLRGALNNGCSKEEIMEVFLQTAIYCGIPASVDSFRTAKEFFQESK
jgi:4-carboxymuconolactone decarboxylase